MMNTRKNRIIQLLRWSERYTKTDMVYLASGGFWLAAGQAGAAVTAFAFSILVARYLSPDTYGAYKYILSLVSIVGAISLTGLGTTIVRSVARGFDSALKAGYYRNLFWSGPTVLSFLGIAAYYYLNGASLLAGAILIAGLCTPLINSATLFNAFWSGKKNFARQTIFWSIANSGATAAAIVAVLMTDNILFLTGTYFIASATINGILYFITLRFVEKDRSPDTGSDLDAVHLSVLNFLNTVSGNMDKIIVYHLLGTAQLAVYSFALAIPDQIRATLKAGARLALPRFAERKMEEIRETLGIRMVRFSIVILAIAAAYIAFAPFIYSTLFPTYVDAVPYSQLFVLTLFTVLGAAPLTALQAHAKNRALYQYSIATNIIQIGSSIFFIASFGLWGAAASLIINRTIGLFLPLYLLRRHS